MEKSAFNKVTPNKVDAIFKFTLILNDNAVMDFGMGMTANFDNLPTSKFQ